MNVDAKYLRMEDVPYSPHRLCIIIDGPTLTWALEDKQLSNKFFKLCIIANSVICCRVSPKQKASVVELAKRNGEWVTLSIGDGANDVPMILEAHIGIGIRGKEGTQAVRSADYSISQFRFLVRLLLVHGRWGYRRVSWMVCYYFYKNIILVFTEIYFAFYNGFSGQIFFADWLPMLYNALWTSWQCLFAFVFEQDVNPEYAYKFPVVYQAGTKRVYFNFAIFWRWIIFSIWHGFIIFFGVTISFQGPQAQGLTPNHWFLQTICFSQVVIIIVAKLFMETVYWHWISIATGILSIFLYFLTVLIGNTETVSHIF